MNEAMQGRSGLPLSAARQAKRAPANWRLWIACVAIVAAQAVPYALPAMALVILLLFWNSLHSQASDYVASMSAPADTPKRSRSDFAAHLLTACGYVVLAAAGLAEWAGDEAAPVVVFTMLAVGSWLALSMFRMWWRIPHAVAASIAMLAAGWLAIELSPLPVQPDLSALDQWGREFPRLLAVFGVAAVVMHAARSGRSELRRPADAVEKLIYTLAFISVLALVNSLTPTTPDNRWMALMTVLLLGCVAVTWLARFQLGRDLRLAGDWLRTWGRSSEAAPMGGFVSAAFVPPIALASIDDVRIWLGVLLISTIACILKSAARRRRLARLRRSPTPSPAKKIAAQTHPTAILNSSGAIA